MEKIISIDKNLSLVRILEFQVSDKGSIDWSNVQNVKIFLIGDCMEVITGSIIDIIEMIILFSCIDWLSIMLLSFANNHNICMMMKAEIEQ